MSISLNLLPPQVKAEIRSHQRTARFLSWSVWGGVGLLALVAAFAIGNIWLKIVAGGQKRNIAQTEESLKRFEAIENDLRAIGERVVSLEKQEKERVVWSKVVEDLTAATPSAVRVTSATMNQRSDVQVKLNGFAFTKSDVALFRDRLEASSRFQGMSVESVGTAAAGGKVQTTFSIVGQLEKTQ